MIEKAVRGGRGATLHDVAREAGVSLSTASRVLNGSTRRVADGYRTRVETASRRLGYTANLSAQATARGTSAVVALLVADIADPYFSRIAAGVVRGADEAGVVVTIAMTERDGEREANLVRALRGQRPRGLILASSRLAGREAPTLAHEIEAFQNMGARVVALGRGPHNLPSVPIDNFGGARALGLALAGHGYRRAVVLAAERGVLSSDDRVAGFAAGFAEGGGTGVEVRRGAFTREAGWRTMNEALAAGVEPGTLVFGANDVVAIGAMSALRAAGRALGQDVAVCGFDDIPTSRDVAPALTTVRIPLEDVGYQALRSILDEDCDPGATRITLDVVLRDSTPPRTPTLRRSL